MDHTFEQIVDSQRTGLLLLDQELAVTFVNPSAEHILGRSAELTVGLPVSELLEGNGEMLSTLKRAIAEQQGFTSRQVGVIRPDQTQQLIDYSAIPANQGLLLELHTIDTRLWFARDEQSTRQQETTRELTRGLAHEVKNPLGGIRGATQLLAMELTDPEMLEYTDVILSEVDRLRDLVDRMLGPRVAPEFAPTNVHEVLERVINLCGAEFNHLKFNRDYDPSLPDLEADRDRLFQACFNIARNAAEAMHQTKDACLTLKTRIAHQLTVGRQLHKRVLKIEIEDNGPGVPEELKDRLFYPMISGRADGTGLGLAMAHSIVGEHHGAIGFESVPGRTIFTIYLPLTQPHNTEEQLTS